MGYANLLILLANKVTRKKEELLSEMVIQIPSLLYERDFEDEYMKQIFIEPKGNEFIGDDGTFKKGKEGWKEKFLEEITEKYGFEKVIKAENPNYRLIGLPFFNKGNNSSFKEKYELMIEGG